MNNQAYCASKVKDEIELISIRRVADALTLLTACHAILNILLFQARYLYYNMMYYLTGLAVELQDNGKQGRNVSQSLRESI